MQHEQQCPTFFGASDRWDTLTAQLLEIARSALRGGAQGRCRTINRRLRRRRFMTVKSAPATNFAIDFFLRPCYMTNQIGSVRRRLAAALASNRRGRPQESPPFGARMNMCNFSRLSCRRMRMCRERAWDAKIGEDKRKRTSSSLSCPPPIKSGASSREHPVHAGPRYLGFVPPDCPFSGYWMPAFAGMTIERNAVSSYLNAYRGRSRGGRAVAAPTLASRTFVPVSRPVSRRARTAGTVFARTNPTGDSRSASER